uniref:Endonuclease/exonuclease/phosphatase domain-containing protein n=1 Tax=Latimeria chalumnae TaxID=7897 RepID=H3A9D7_LATCH
EKGLNPMTTCFITWNVNAINNLIKRYKILSYLNRLGADMALIQEAHFIPTEMRKPRTRWFNSKSRDVCILISKNTPFIELEAESDKEGRFVVVRGIIRGTEVTIVSLYAQSQDPTRRYVGLAHMLAKYKDTSLTIGGDARLGRSGPSLPSNSSTSRALQQFSREMGLINIWIALHQGKRDYIFYFSAHQFYSRLDSFMVSQQVGLGTLEVSNMSNCYPIMVQPHLIFSLPDLKINKGFVSQLQQAASSFFQINENTVTSKLILGDAFKATIRGWIISQATYKKKVYKIEWLKLEEELTKLETEHKASPEDSEILGTLQKTQLDLQNIINHKTEYALFKSKERYFAVGDKAGKLLAHHLKKLEMANMIYEIRSKDIDNHSTSEGIDKFLNTFGFLPLILDAITALYSSPKACVIA